MQLAPHFAAHEEIFEEIEYFVLTHAEARPNAVIAMDNIEQAAEVLGGFDVGCNARKSRELVFGAMLIRLYHKHANLRGMIRLPQFTKKERLALMRFGVCPVTGEVLW